MIRFCSQCGGETALVKPIDDYLERSVCSVCKTVHYENPRLVVGTIPRFEDKILLCRRAIEPAKGMWTIPAGYLELNESMEQGAIRETLEETGAEVTNLSPYAIYDIVHIGQIYMLFLGSLIKTDFHPTAESLEVKLVEPQHIPWENIAFPVIEEVLQKYTSDQLAGNFTFETGQITTRMRNHIKNC